MSLKYKIKGQELVLETCPECGNAHSNFQISLSEGKAGLVHCWACDFKGSISRLAMRAGVYRDIYAIYLKVGGKSVVVEVVDAPVQSVVVPEGFRRIMFCEEALVLHYLRNRGVSQEDAERFGIEYRGVELLFKLKDREGGTRYWVKKDIVSGRYMLPEGKKSDVVWYIRNGAPVVLIVEGIFDGFRVWQAGHDVIVLLGKIAYASVIQYIKGLKDMKVIVALDSDAVKEARDMTEMLGKVAYGMLEYTEDERLNLYDVADLSVEGLKQKVAVVKPYGIADKVKHLIGR